MRAAIGDAVSALLLRSLARPLARSQVVIIVIDIMSFTEMCTRVNAIDVMIFLDDFFSAIDKYALQRQIIKLRTIGDGCVSSQTCNIIGRARPPAPKLLQCDGCGTRDELPDVICGRVCCAF